MHTTDTQPRKVTDAAIELAQLLYTTLPHPMPPTTTGLAHTTSPLKQQVFESKLKLCSSCKQLRPLAAYSNGQLKKNGKRRCQDCILVNQPPTISRTSESEDESEDSHDGEGEDEEEDEENEDTDTVTDEKEEKKVEEDSKAILPSVPLPHSSIDRHGHAQLCHECAAVLHLEYQDSCVQLIRKGYVPTYTMHKKARKGKNIPTQLG